MYLNGFLESTWMREVILLAVKSNGLALAGSDYTDDKEVVIAAVKNHGYALEFASPSLKQDKEVVMAALRNDGSAIQFAGQLRFDHEVIKASFKNNRYALFYHHVMNNKELVLAVSQMGSMIHHIPRHLYYDRDIICAAVKENGNLIRFFKEDPVLLFYAKYSKHPKLLTQHQEEMVSTFVNQKNKERYNYYWIKTIFSGHEVGFLSIIQTFI